MPGDEDDIDINATLHDRVSGPARRVADAIDEIGDEAEETAASLAAMAAAEEAARVETERLENAIRDQSIQLRDAQKQYDVTSKKLRKLDEDFQQGRISAQEYSEATYVLTRRLTAQKNSIRSLSGHLTRYKNQLAQVNGETSRFGSELNRSDKMFKRMTARMKGGGIGVLDRLGNSIKNISAKPIFASVGILSVLAFTILPILIPGAAALGVVFGGMTTAIVAATAATALWGGVAAAAVSRLMKNQEKAVGPGKKLVDQIKRLKGEWSSFLDHTEGGIFLVLAKGLRIVNDNMGEFEPVINAVSKAMGVLVDDLDRWAKKGGFEGMAKFLEKSARLIIPLGRGLGYMAVGIGNVFEAFFPLAELMSGNFQSNMERFAKSTENLGDNPKFKAFVQYGLDNLPRFKELLGNIADTAWNVVMAFKPWADFLLPIVNRIFEILGNMDPMALAIGFGALAITFGYLAGGVGGTLLALAGLGLILTNLHGKSKRFQEATAELRDMVQKYWGDIKTKAQEVWTNTVEPALEKLANKIETRFIPAWKRAWPYIRPVIDGLMKFATSTAIEQLGAVIKGIAWALGLMVDSISNHLDMFTLLASGADDFVNALQSAHEWISTVKSDIDNFGGGAGSFLTGLVPFGGLLYAGGETKPGENYMVGEFGPEAWITAKGAIEIIGKGGPEIRKFSSHGAVVPASAVADPFGGNTGNAPDWAVDALRSRAGELVDVASGPVTHGPSEPVSGGDTTVYFGDIHAYTEMDIEGAVRRGINKAEEDKKERK